VEKGKKYNNSLVSTLVEKRAGVMRIKTYATKSI
jgi:hypothetical protein